MGIDCDFLVNLSVQCLVPKRRRRRSSRESQSSGKVSTTSTIVSTNSNRYAIVILLLLSFIFTLRLQTRSSVEPDYKAQLEVEEQRIRVVRSRYSELTSRVRQSALFPRHSNHTFPSSTSYYQRQKNLTSILQKTKPRHTSPLPPRS